MARHKPNELYIERIYDAPVNVVWDAWADPKQIAKWWGPRGFTHTTKSKELRAGGQWIYTMHGPDGVDYPNIATYHEVIPYSRLVYDHGATETTPPLFRVTVNFIDLKGKTKMEMTMALENEEAAKQIGKFIKQAGGNATWDRLGEHVEKELSGKEKFVINRTFKAPINVMFEMFTNPEHFSKWLPPTGMSMSFLKAEIKEGGISHYQMSDGKGFSLYSKAHYVEIKTPTRIVYTQEFCDENAKVQKAPFNIDWPLKTQTTVDFMEETSLETRIRITTEVIGDYTSSELEAFIKEKGGMTVGWTGSLDKLEAKLEEDLEKK